MDEAEPGCDWISEIFCLSMFYFEWSFIENKNKEINSFYKWKLKVIFPWVWMHSCLLLNFIKLCKITPFYKLDHIVEISWPIDMRTQLSCLRSKWTYCTHWGGSWLSARQDNVGNVQSYLAWNLISRYDLYITIEKVSIFSWLWEKVEPQ